MTVARRRRLGRVLVTGARGFLGAAVVKYLKAAGHSVVPTDLETTDPEPLATEV